VAAIGDGGGGGGGLLPPPPPQPGAKMINANIADANIAKRYLDLRRRPEVPINPTERNMKLARAVHLARWARRGGSSMAEDPGAVVVTVIAEGVVLSVPGAVIEDWLNRQPAPMGNPEQAREMVPVNPVEEETATEVEPDAPGAETATRD